MFCPVCNQLYTLHCKACSPVKYDEAVVVEKIKENRWQARYVALCEARKILDKMIAEMEQEGW